MNDSFSEKILDGKMVAERIKNVLRKEAKSLKENGVVPKLSIVLAGKDAPSKMFIRMKQKACQDIGIQSELLELPENILEEELIKIINKLNSSKEVTGFIIQLPMPSHINGSRIFETINPQKDVDCLNPVNFGKLVQGTGELLPCTPKGILRLLKEYKIEVSGKNVAVVNASNIIGKPLAMMLIKEGATVTLCHSRTRNLASQTRDADILITATGVPKLIKEDMVKEGSVVIDAGINYSEGRPVGDVDFEKVRQKASFITPVPGGVGPMTVAMVLENILYLIKNASINN